MSTMHLVQVACDSCHVKCHPQTPEPYRLWGVTSRKLAEIRAEAAEHGWTVKRHAHGLDLCPQCTKDGWGPADELCPKCRCATLTAPWWDDLPDNGGQVVGTLHTCTNRMCDWFDSR